ncbi:dihydroorotase [Candidatus Micrarchaeota archaeon]|nr:dihydroorotase [Candidatus Micrarchaeota archaeon]
MGFLITNARIIEKNNVLRIVEILVEDESIAAVSETGTHQAKETIDAKNMLVLPGLVDPHVHFRDSGVPNVAQKAKEDFSSGSKAALAGGVTVALDMPNTVPPTVSVQDYKTKAANASKTSYCDFGLYAGASNDNLNEIPKMLDAGAIAVKLFMGSSTGNLLVDSAEAQEKIFALGAELNFILAVHAEDEECIRFHADFYNDKKIRSHNEVRPAKCAETAVSNVIDLVRKHNNPTYILHVSTAKEVELIRSAKKTLPVFMEVTPHHLFLNESDEETQKNRVKINPPVRTEKDNEALWIALNNCTVDAIGTDHAPHTLDEKRKPYWEAPSGFPGIETRLPLMITAALEHRTTLEIVQRTCCQNPATIFRLPNKGFIAKGYDADLVFVDLSEERRVEDEKMFSRSKWSPYAGKNLRGWPSLVYLRGRKVYEHGTFFGPFGKEVTKN